MATWIKGVGVFLTFCFAFTAYVFFQIPSEKKIKGCLITEMYGVELCPGSGSYVPLKNISGYLQKAVIITEDSSFYSHDGFDWDSIEKSAKENIVKKAYRRGGSTISQQLAKNMFLWKEKSLYRKFLEFFITRKIEKVLTKKEILERYLNVVEFGKNIYGVKAASRHYFQKSPGSLNVSESAFLAMLLPNPKKYSASFASQKLTPFAYRRIRRIINDMYRYQKISIDEFDVATAELSSFFGHPTPTETTLSGATTDNSVIDGEGGELEELEEDETN